MAAHNLTAKEIRWFKYNSSPYRCDQVCMVRSIQTANQIWRHRYQCGIESLLNITAEWNQDRRKVKHCLFTVTFLYTGTGSHQR